MFILIIWNICLTILLYANAFYYGKLERKFHRLEDQLDIVLKFINK